jgi:hypothetical protein
MPGLHADEVCMSWTNVASYTVLCQDTSVHRAAQRVQTLPRHKQCMTCAFTEFDWELFRLTWTFSVRAYRYASCADQ